MQRRRRRPGGFESALEPLLRRIDRLDPGEGASDILSELIVRYRRMQRRNARLVWTLHGLAAVLWAVIFGLGLLQEQPSLAAASACVTLFVLLRNTFQLLRVPARRLRDAPGEWLGSHTVASIEAVVHELARASRCAVPALFVLEDRGEGTSCLHLPGLARFVTRAHAIYLDPHDVQPLRADEVRALLAHEMGHLGPYPHEVFELSFAPLLMALGCCISLVVAKTSLALSLVLLLPVPLAGWIVISHWVQDAGREVELLADAHAARHGAALPLINTLLKLSARHEVEHVLAEELAHVLATDTAASPRELEAAARAALGEPFVCVAEAQHRIRSALAPYRGSRNILSDADRHAAPQRGALREWIHEVYEEHQRRSRMHRIRWLDYDQNVADQCLDPIECHAFLTALGIHADAVLPVDIDHDDLVATHPRLRRRVLLLGAQLPAASSTPSGGSRRALSLENPARA